MRLDLVKSEGYCFQIELTYMAHKKGFKIKEVPIIFTDRTAGKSKISRRIALEAIINVHLMRLRPSDPKRAD